MQNVKSAYALRIFVNKEPPARFALRSFPLLPLIAHTACASGERGCLCCGVFRPYGPELCAGTAGGQGENGCRKAPSERPAQRLSDGYANATGSRAPAILWRSSDGLMPRASSMRRTRRCAAGKKFRDMGRTKADASSDDVRGGLVKYRMRL